MNNQHKIEALQCELEKVKADNERHRKLNLEYENQLIEARRELAASEASRKSAEQSVEALMGSNCNMNDTLRSRGFTKGSTEERLIALAQAFVKSEASHKEFVEVLKDLAKAKGSNDNGNSRNHKE